MIRMPRRKYDLLRKKNACSFTDSLRSCKSVSCIHLRAYPWLLWNIRNPALFGKWLGYIRHEKLSSILFLVIYALIHRGSNLLATSHYITFTERGDFSLYASVLA